MKEALIKISPDGSEVELEGKTFQGSACEDFLKPIQEALGEVVSSKKKPEYFLGENQKVKV